jgi:hypothetical protein
VDDDHFSWEKTGCDPHTYCCESDKCQSCNLGGNDNNKKGKKNKPGG